VESSNARQLYKKAFMTGGPTAGLWRSGWHTQLFLLWHTSGKNATPAISGAAAVANSQC